jgi:hypothetical protein
MKRLVLIIISLMLGGQIYGQIADPSLTSPTVVPSPGLVGGPVTASFGFQNLTTTSVPYSSIDPTLITVTLNKIRPDIDLVEDTLIYSVSGNPTHSLFNWVAACVTNCADGDEANDIWVLTGTQNQIIPKSNSIFDQMSQIYAFPGTIIAASTIEDANANNGHGFNANITPCVAAACDQDNSSTSNNQSVFGYTNGVLPISLLRFDATKVGRQVMLDWVTVTEINNDHFDVEKSGDGFKFEKIGEVKGQGNSAKQHSYVLYDKNPFIGDNYYRLKQVDFDGKYEYSQIEIVNFSEQRRISVQPNPAAESFWISTGSDDDVMVEIHDDIGKIIYNRVYTPGDKIDLTNTSAGVYLVKVYSLPGDEMLKVEKLVKVE